MSRKSTSPSSTADRPQGQELGVALLNRASLFGLNMKCWGGKAKADLGKVSTDADRTWLRLRKTLLESEEFLRIRQHQIATRQWCMARSMPSFLRNGIYFVGLTEVERYEQHLATAVRELRTDLVPRFLEVYPRQRNAAKASLKKLYNPDDYPTVEEMEEKFGIEWNWIYFGLPENLPALVREREAEKLKAAYANAQVEIVAALRSGFADIVSHMVEKLKVEPGKKPPVFKDTLVANMNEFIENFPAKNLMQDDELAALVTKAKQIVNNVEAEDLREQAEVRDRVAGAFAEIKQTVDRMIVPARGRKFDLHD